MLKYLILASMFILISCKDQPTKGEQKEEVTIGKEVDDKVESEIAEQLSTKVDEKTEVIVDKEETSPSVPLPTPADHLNYAWIDRSLVENSINTRITPPTGYIRKAAAKGSFADWLRHLPLKPEGSPVHLYDGRLKGNQNAHFAVLDIDPGKRDLQQCADAVMRLKAEYHFANKEYDKIHFNYTSGDRVSFSDWAIGRKPIIKGNKVSFSAAGDRKDYSYANFRKYLIQIFSYAGTASLSKELKKIKPADVSIGDVFIRGGFPGHAVIVVDMAENEEGEKRFMLAQSYMPAQEIHILHNPAQEVNSPWYRPDFGNTLETPEWSFSSDELKRFSN